MKAELLRERLRQGRQLHEQRRYDEALAVYRTILQADPSEPGALYEMALTLNANNEPRQAQALLEQLTARGMLPVPGGRELMARAFGLLGAIHDGLGELGLGEQTFRRGLESFRVDGGLRFALGVNLLAQGKAAEATEELMTNLAIRPDHPRGWAVAGDALGTTNDWAWALLARGRSLTLDLDAAFAKRTATRLWSGLFAGVDAQAKTVRVPSSANDEDGARRTSENMAVAVNASGRYREWADKSDAEFLPLALEKIVQILGELATNGGVPRSRLFWHRELHGFFSTARGSGGLVTAAYLMRAPLGDPATNAWLAANAPDVDRFRAWAKSFRAAPAA
jgi:tetratricopeptide (TPR) repeat protein